MSGAIDLTSVTGLGALAPRLVGQIMGTPYKQYRPSASGAVAALDAANLLRSLSAWLAVDSKLMATAAPVKPQPVWYGGFDPSLTQPGDYLVGGFGTFFIATQLLPAPISLIYCNGTYTVTRNALPAAGASFRGGTTMVKTTIATDFPGFLAVSTRRSQNELHLPGTVEQQNATLLLPASIPAQIMAGDTITTGDTIPVRYSVQGSALSQSGWTLNLVQATA